MTLSPRREPTHHSPPALTSLGAAQSQDPLGAWDPQGPIGPSPSSPLASIPRENQEARRLGPGTDCHRFWTRSQQLGNCPGKGAVPGCHVPPTHRPGPTWKLRSRSPLGSGLLSMWLVTRRPRWSRGALMTGSSHEEGATDTQGHAKGPERCCHTPRGVRAAGNHGGQGSGEGRRPFPPEASRGAQPCRHRDFGPMAPRTVREHIRCFMPLSLRPFVRVAPQTKALTSNHAPRIQMQNTGDDRTEASSKPCPDLLGDCGQAGPPL